MDKKIIEENDKMKEIMIRQTDRDMVKIIVWKDVKQIEILVEQKRWKNTMTFSVPFKDDEIDDLAKILSELG